MIPNVSEKRTASPKAGRGTVQVLRDKDSEVSLAVTLCLLNPGFAHDVSSDWDTVPSPLPLVFSVLKPARPAILDLEVTF